MINEIILGIVQGITEWLPISSTAMVILIQDNLLGGIPSITDSLELALFLHLGTFFAALIYFRTDVIQILKTLFAFNKSEKKDKNVLVFLIITTILSGLIALFFYTILDVIEDKIEVTSRGINFFIGVMLLITAFAQLNPKARNSEEGRSEKDLNYKDSIILGSLQGISPIPGISRSGITVSALLLRKIKETVSLKLSFLMSLPIVLGGNVVLALIKTDEFIFSASLLLPLIFSFIFGILTIHFLLKLAKKISFAYFALVIGVLLVLASALPVI